MLCNKPASLCTSWKSRWGERKKARAALTAAVWLFHCKLHSLMILERLQGGSWAQLLLHLLLLQGGKVGSKVWQACRGGKAAHRWTPRGLTHIQLLDRSSSWHTLQSAESAPCSWTLHLKARGSLCHQFVAFSLLTTWNKFAAYKHTNLSTDSCRLSRHATPHHPLPYAPNHIFRALHATRLSWFTPKSVHAPRVNSCRVPNKDRLSRDY